MQLADSTKELMRGLPRKKINLINAFVESLEKKPEFLEEACVCVVGKIEDKQLAGEFNKLSGDIKKTACIEYLIIGLSSGDIKEKELQEMIGY